METEKVKRFQAMILAEYNRGLELRADFIPEKFICAMIEGDLKRAASEADSGNLEQACRQMICAGALVLRFLADADPYLDGLPQKK